MHRYNVVDSLMLGGLLAVLVTLFVQAGPAAGSFLVTLFIGSAYLGYKSAFVQLRREAERDKRNNP